MAQSRVVTFQSVSWRLSCSLPPRGVAARGADAARRGFRQPPLASCAAGARSLPRNMELARSEALGGVAPIPAHSTWPGRLRAVEHAGAIRRRVDFAATLKTGWHHSEWTSRRVVQVGLDKVHVTGSWQRYTEDGRASSAAPSPTSSPTIVAVGRPVSFRRRADNDRRAGAFGERRGSGPRRWRIFQRLEQSTMPGRCRSAALPIRTHR